LLLNILITPANNLSMQLVKQRDSNVMLFLGILKNKIKIIKLICTIQLQLLIEKENQF
jgi:hypothetical protein